MKQFIITTTTVLTLNSSMLCMAQPVVATDNPLQQPSMSTMLAKVMPVVVNITVRGEIPFSQENGHSKPAQNDKDAPPFMLPSRKFESAGSGVVIDAKNGYIVTNSHVIRNSNVLIVTLSDGRKVKATVIGVDPATDIAVLQAKDKYLKAIELADTSKLHPGDFVAAIGNPFGLHQTVTSGVISALNRSIGIEGPGGYENFIQTDASINPGNSGGALVNMKGELVGINTAILAPQGGNIGIGFAIPSNMVKSVVDQLIQYHKVNRGLLGVMVQDLTPALAEAFDMAEAKGAVVTHVNEKSAAQTAGLHEQDVVEAINDEAIANAAHLRSIVGISKIGDTLKLSVRRQNKQLKMTATIESLEKALHEAEVSQSFLSGVRLNNIDQIDTQNKVMRGVLVLEVTDNSNAWLAGLRPGDLILKANGEKADTIPTLTTLAKKDQKRLLLTVQRGLASLFVVIT
ncbi:MAG: Do family serine endopeptidase [Pseudomonadota bacterium]|nr:Do family serine endopeptidase [Pseudomonadota bacterium]